MNDSRGACRAFRTRESSSQAGAFSPLLQRRATRPQRSATSAICTTVPRRSDPVKGPAPIHERMENLMCSSVIHVCCPSGLTESPEGDGSALLFPKTSHSIRVPVSSQIERRSDAVGLRRPPNPFAKRTLRSLHRNRCRRNAPISRNRQPQPLRQSLDPLHDSLGTFAALRSHRPFPSASRAESVAEP
jgi:hypothetical protein